MDSTPGTRDRPSRAARYTIVVVSGFLIDLAVAFLAVRFLPVPLAAGAVIGFAAAFAYSYPMHEFWTYRSGHSRLSGRRVLRMLLAAGFTLAIRAFVLLLLAPVATGEVLEALALVAAAGTSFVINFFVLERLVFARLDG